MSETLSALISSDRPRTSWSLEDLQSKNGTWVAGQPTARRTLTAPQISPIVVKGHSDWGGQLSLRALGGPARDALRHERRGGAVSAAEREAR